MLPPEPLFGSLAYQLCPRSLKSWWWRLTAWRIFTPPQKKGLLISERVKEPLCTKIRSPLKGTREECWNVGSMNCNFSVTFSPFYSYVLGCQAFEQEWSWRWPCYDKKPCCFWNVNDFVIMLTRYWSLSQHGQLQPDPKSKAWQQSTQL